MKFKKLLDDQSIVYKTCKTVIKETNPTSFWWMIVLGFILPRISGDEYYSYLAAIIIGIVVVHFISKFQKSLNGMSQYVMYREILSFLVLCVSMITIYGMAVYNSSLWGGLITIAVFLWIIPTLIAGIALIIPTLIDIILLGEIKNEKNIT